MSTIQSTKLLILNTVMTITRGKSHPKLAGFGMRPLNDLRPEKKTSTIIPREIDPNTIPKFVNMTSEWLRTPKCWPASWSTRKTDPITQVWKFDLWMTFDPPNRDFYHDPHGKRIPRPPKFFELDLWMTFDPTWWTPSWSPEKNWSHHQSLRTWPLDDLWPQKWWHTSWSPGKPDPTTNSCNRARFHTHKSKKQHLTIYKFDLPFSSLNLIYKQIICNLPIWKIQPLSDVFLFKNYFLFLIFLIFVLILAQGSPWLRHCQKLTQINVVVVVVLFFVFLFCLFVCLFVCFFCPLAPLPPFKLAVFIQRDYLIEDLSPEKSDCCWN